MTSILVDTSLFTHYIEEILIFSQRLFEDDINYPQNLPNCMNLLCDEIVFEKWFQVEQDGKSNNPSFELPNTSIHSSFVFF
jgi:hypothetical protein